MISIGGIQDAGTPKFVIAEFVVDAFSTFVLFTDSRGHDTVDADGTACTTHHGWMPGPA